MSLRKTGTCKDCKKTLYGDEYGASGHKCEAKKKKAKPREYWILRSRAHRTKREALQEVSEILCLPIRWSTDVIKVQEVKPKKGKAK